MKCLVALSLLFCSMLACRRPASHADTAEQLKTTMSDYLKKAAAKDSLKMQFDVTDVTYYKDSTFFECEFKVHMKGQGRDTTGVMTARIAADFSKVVRKS